MTRRRTSVSVEARAELERWVAEERPSLAQRAKIVLLDTEGWSTQWIARELGIARLTVYKWRRRFSRGGMEALRDLPRPGQPRKLTPQARDTLVRWTRFSIPGDSIGWSIRRLARAAGVTEHQVRGAWKLAGVPPERIANAIDEAQRWLDRGARPLALDVTQERAVWLFETSMELEVELVPRRRRPSAAHLERRRHRLDSVYAACAAVRSPRPSSEPDAERWIDLVTRFAARPGRDAAVHVVLSADHDAWPAGLLSAIEGTPNVRVSTLPTLDAWIAATEAMLIAIEAVPSFDDVRREMRDLRRSIEAFAESWHGLRDLDDAPGSFGWTCTPIEPVGRHSGFFAVEAPCAAEI